jgi:ribosomal protein S18 acetylase RimI-like enzyme
MKLKIVELTEQYRNWAREYLQESWGSGGIVSRGNLYQAGALPGFIALWEEEPSGLLTYNIVDNACEIVTLNSLIEKKGVGSALIEAVRRQAILRGCSRVWLITTNDNVEALRFYQRRGFELVAVHRNAIEHSRTLKPSIPLIGNHGIPIRDEIELEIRLV